MSSLAEALVEVRDDASLTFESFPQWPHMFDWFNLAAAIHEKAIPTCGSTTFRFIRRVCRVLIERAESSTCCSGLQLVCNYALKLCAGKLLTCNDTTRNQVDEADNPPSNTEARHALPAPTDDDMLVIQSVARDCNGLISNPCNECDTCVSIAALFTPLAHIDTDSWRAIRTEYYRFLKFVFLNTTLNVAACVSCQQSAIARVKAISAVIYPIEVDSDDEFETPAV